MINKETICELYDLHKGLDVNRVFYTNNHTLCLIKAKCYGFEISPEIIREEIESLVGFIQEEFDEVINIEQEGRSGGWLRVTIPNNLGNLITEAEMAVAYEYEGWENFIIRFSTLIEVAAFCKEFVKNRLQELAKQAA